MSEPTKDPKAPEAKPEEKRPYEKPAVEDSQVFERQSLACTGKLNMTTAFPARCTLQS